MGTLSGGSISAIFIFAGPLNWGQLLKERICSYGNKFFSFTRESHFGTAMLSREVKSDSSQLTLMEKTGKNKMAELLPLQVYPILLKSSS